MPLIMIGTYKDSLEDTGVGTVSVRSDWAIMPPTLPAMKLIPWSTDLTLAPFSCPKEPPVIIARGTASYISLFIRRLCFGTFDETDQIFSPLRVWSGFCMPLHSCIQCPSFRHK